MAQRGMGQERVMFSSKIQPELRVCGMSLCDIDYFGVGSAGKKNGTQLTDTAPSRWHSLEVMLL